AAALQQCLAAKQPGERLVLHVFRREELREFTLVLVPKPLDTWIMTLGENPAAEVLARRQAWLGA
ncbi:MAG: peptidase M61, partial [Acidobacteria bacterium]|nr:peptidase M61 [Acidobacteriota bacterium]